MQSNIDKYKTDLTKLEDNGVLLMLAMWLECRPEEFEAEYKKKLKNKYSEFLKTIPTFSRDYQNWYSESHAVIKQLIPDRLQDFIRLYEKPKGRKEIVYGNYVIEDYLQGLQVTSGGRVKVDKSAAVNQFKQQRAILKSANLRFDSSLFDIVQLVQADLLDSELDAARILQKTNFIVPQELLLVW